MFKDNILFALKEISECGSHLPGLALLHEPVADRYEIKGAIASVCEVLAPDVECVVPSAKLHLSAKQSVELLRLSVSFVPEDIAYGFAVDVKRNNSQYIGVYGNVVVGFTIDGVTWRIG